MRVVKLTALLAGLSLGAGLIACRADRTAPQRRFDVSGKVVSVDKQQRILVLAHEEIRGYMGSMTMGFMLKDEWAYGVLEPGDRVQATLVVDGRRSWLQDLVITKAGTREAGALKSAGPPGPKPGDEVPDFSLVNQDGKRIHIHQYRGQALLLTFIYTRCPLPDYCPLMSKNFAEIGKALLRDGPLYSKTQMLSISVDPDYDTPPVLRRYGLEHAGRHGGDPFKHWEFACGTRRQVKEAAEFFGLRYSQEGGQIVHSLETALIAPDGRVFKSYRGNDWNPADVLRDIQSLKLH